MVDFYPVLHASALAPGGVAEVGNKAWNLMLMARAGLPTPPAFVLPTAWCKRNHPADELALRKALAAGMTALDSATGLSFGGARNPLLVSVRSGASVSMPGMMETVLDIGINRNTVESLIRMTGNPRLAWDCFRRCVQGYAVVVAGLPAAPFDMLVARALVDADVASEPELDHRSLKSLTLAMLDSYQTLQGSPFPDDPHEQLFHATLAVFATWDAPKAVSYRRLNGISNDGGTAVTIQMMVYGNAGGSSGAGVGFTRDPATGAPDLYYDFIFNAQGDDVVGGRQALDDTSRLQRLMPLIWSRLGEIRGVLESVFRDAQDFEFTVQSAILYLLQTRRAKRTDWAAVMMAVGLAEEGVVTPTEALATLDKVDLAGVVRTHFMEPLPPALIVAVGASLGVASGAIALDVAAAKRMSASGGSVVLVREDMATTDIEGIALAVGILTGKGGRTSHAAVVARQLGRVCLVGCPDLVIDLKRRQAKIGASVVKEGEMVSLAGDTGAIYPGSLTITSERPEAALATIANWHRKADAA